MSLRFGYFLDPDASDPAPTIEVAQRVERLGFDLIGIQDHPYQPRHFDSWSLISYLIASTSRVRIFPDVVNLSLRPPAVLAKGAATLDLLSGGRFELGIGAGGFPEAVQAMGGPSRSPGEAVEALSEAIEIIRLMWSGQRSVRFHGRHYSVDGVRPGPSPGRAIEVWVGAGGPRMLDLIGRSADGWIPSMAYVPPIGLPDANRRIDRGAEASGRDPRSIRRIYNIWGGFAEEATAGGSDADTQILGPPRHWVEVLARLTSVHRIDTIVVGGPSDPGNLDRFAEEVIPPLRSMGPE